MAASGDSSSDDAIGVSTSTTKTSTPATSVLGEDSNTKKRSAAIRHRATSRSTLSKAIDAPSESDSGLSDIEANEVSRGHASKKLKTTQSQGESGRKVGGGTFKLADTPNEVVARTVGGSTVSATSKRSRRGNSPEVVVYVKNASSSAASRSSNKLSAASPRMPKSVLGASSSPASRFTEIKAEEKDGEETEDDMEIRRDTSSARKGKRKVIESEEEEFEPLKEELDDIEDEEEMITTATQLLARQVAKNINEKLASSPLGRKDKGKGRASQVTASSSKETVIKQTQTKKVTAKMPRKSLEKLKKEVVSGSNEKGKGKKIQSSDEEDDSDFIIEDEANEAIASGVDDDSSDLSDVDGAGAASASRARPKAKGKKRNVGPDGRKLTWWEKNDLALQAHHPELRNVWENLRVLEVIKPQKAEQPTGLTMQMLPFQLEGLYWMQQQEKGPWKGGLLADEMGMGKTIQMISLILTDFDPKAKDRTHTLILAPTVAIMQWRNEFNKFTSGMKVCVWHGGNRTNDKKELLKYDVILTSYAVLESSFRRQNSGYKRKGELIKEDSVLHSIDWHRVILDEAHNIKDRSCNTARGAFALKANFKWCLSGTPLQNRVGELYSLIRFCGVDPFAYYYCKKCPCKALHWRFSNKRTCDECGHTPMHHICYWNNEILKPIQKHGAAQGTHGASAFEKLSLLLARMMLRRTKVERADDMGLPPRAIMVRRDYFTEEEEEFYTSLYSDVKRTFSTYVAADSLLNNYANVFQLLTRMRQTACHPDMVLKGAAAKALLGESVNKAALTISTCRLCLDEGDDPIMSKCRHVFCRECIRQYLETAIEVEPECPVCHLPLTIDLNQEPDQELVSAQQGMLAKIDPGKWRTSTKIEALVEELSQLKTEDHSIKSLVFSQFTSFLDIIARRLQLAGFKVARLQGNMTPEARDRTVKYFMNNTECTVFLLSLKAGGVALNLTEASRVFIMDPWWNPAAELQAMDRHRPVIVKRLIIENSIESKIVELQKKKENMTGAALGDDDQALGRLTPEDLSFLFVM